LGWKGVSDMRAPYNKWDEEWIGQL
jgi:hypothetical protein